MPMARSKERIGNGEAARRGEGSPEELTLFGEEGRGLCPRQWESQPESAGVCTQALGSI